MRDVIEMAREAGFTWEPINNIIGPLKRFEQLVRADERAAQRQWVGLTDEDKLHIEIMGGKSDVMLADMVEAKLKEKNT
jgi:hypothetical protein